MSNDRKTRLRARPHDYNVGFGKPPEEHRFKKGESGNPAGRPRGAKSGKPARPEEWLKAIVLEEAYRDITVGEGDRTVTMPMAQAIIRTLAVEAAKGKPRPQRLFTEMLSTIEQEKTEEHDEFFKIAMDYKFDWEEELEAGPWWAPSRLPVVTRRLTDLASLGEQRVLSRARYCVGGPAATECRTFTEANTSSQDLNSHGCLPVNSRSSFLRITRISPLCRSPSQFDLPFGAKIGSGKPSTMRVDSTLTWTMRRIIAISSRGSSNQALGSLTMPLPLFRVIR